MKCLVAAALLAASLGACAQSRPAPNGGLYNPTSTYGASFTGTLPSRDILSGLAEGRELLLFAGDWDHQVHQGRKTDYRWEVEILPLTLLRNPRQVATATITVPGQPVFIVHTNELVLKPCTSYSSNEVYISGPAGYPTGPGTVSYTQTCSQEWDYLGGISPLGQRVSWRPGERLQPYAIVNAGFLAATQSVPTYSAAKFNFTVEAGFGAEWFLRPRRSIAFDVRYHHLSNAGRADNNPSVENVAFRLSYRLGRR